MRHEIMLDEQGTLVASEVEFKPGELPAAVLNGIKANFPKAVVVKADRQWRAEKPIYFDVTLNQDNQRVDLHLSEDGHITETNWR